MFKVKRLDANEIVGRYETYCEASNQAMIKRNQIIRREGKKIRFKIEVEGQ